MVTAEGLIKVHWDGPGTVFEKTDRWRRRGDVLYATPNVYARGFFVPNDTTISHFDLGWNLGSSTPSAPGT